LKTIPLLLTAVLAGVSIVHAAPAPDDSAPPQAWESQPFSLIPRGFQRDPRLDVNVITEVSDGGRALPRPSAARPTYYVGFDTGLKEEGDLYAGERKPRPELLHDAMIKALRVNGYLLSDAAHPPTQAIYFVWGSFNKLTFTGAGDELELENLAARAALVGGQRFAVEFMQAYSLGRRFVTSFKLKDPHNEWLVDLAESNLYFIIATSYDFAAATQHQKKILWRTKMSTDSNGLTMDGSVPTLVASSGAYFGKESAPVRLDRPMIKEGQVEVGTPTVKNYEDPAAAKPSGVPGGNK
jgi:hypothetical protein